MTAIDPAQPVETNDPEAPVDLVIRNGEVNGTCVDIAINHSTIVALTKRGHSPPAKETFDAEGGAVMPGLHDHHIHLLALAAAKQSTTFNADFPATLRRIDANSPPGTWVRAVGYHESILGDIDRCWLDAIVPHRPVRLQHSTGAMWVLNSAALSAANVESADGRLVGADDLLRQRVPSTPLNLAAVGRQLASYGVTGVSDLTPTTRADEVELLSASVLRPEFPVEVMITGGLELDPTAGAELARGPVKIVVGDHDLPALDTLIDSFGSAHRRRRTVAVHCVTRIGLLLALAAWEEAGVVAGDRIEHGAVIPLDLIPTIVALGLVVVTQPSFIAERGDQYLTDVDADDIDGLWRCGSLIDAGVLVGGSTDAPFGAADPWRAIGAATQRLTRRGVVLGPSERIAAQRALQMFQSNAADPGGPARQVAVGAPAGLCILRTPLATALERLTCDLVAATYSRGGLTTSTN